MNTRATMTRDVVILSLQPKLHVMAARAFSKHAPRTAMIDVPDLIQSANVAMLAAFPRAVTHPDPIAYLLKAGKHAMWDCLYGRCDLIKTYAYQERIEMLSLDVPRTEDGDTLADLLVDEQSDLSHLEAHRHRQACIAQAVDALPTRQREVIERHYGLNGHAPESLNEISRARAKTAQMKRPTNGHYTHRRSLARLRDLLAPSFPQFARAEQEAAS